MRLGGRRESQNVEDRRRMGGTAKAGVGGIGGIIILGLITWLMGGNPLDAIQQAGGLGQLQGQTEAQGREFSREEEELAKFSRQVLAGTEDVWTEVFAKMGREYVPPTLVLFTGSVNSACGSATAAVGPFYCSGDQKLYIDLSFFSQMKSQLGAGGDFAYAYVIAHEVGHHVEHLLGTLGQAHANMERQSKEEANRTSVRLELLADYYAGVWAHHDNKMFGSIEDGDIEEAVNCAHQIGDNYLQEKARGYSQPESFTHGSSEQRMRWLKLGLETGDMEATTFGMPFGDL